VAAAPEVTEPHVLREYALVGDGERGAVVGPHGDIAWLCVPHWHDDPVFAALIGGTSHYTVRPDPPCVWGGAYEDDTMIWRSRWVTNDGFVTSRDALAYPADLRRAVLLRTVEALEAPAAVDVVLRPGARFDHASMSDVQRHDGVWTARAGAFALRWSGAARARVRDRGRELHLRLQLPPRQPHHLILEISDGKFPTDVPDPEAVWQATETSWRRAVPDLDQCTDPASARHSYAVLRGLTSTGGGMVAAATTSLPERAEGGRNYDYRYVWIRDQCYAGHAAAVVGADDLLDAAVGFVSDRLLDDGAHLAPAYTTTGEPVPDERHVGLPGYPGGEDIVGNRVGRQFQLDAFGEALLLLAAAAARDRLDSRSWDAAECAVRAIDKRWTEPDAGIWEIDDRHWTHSRLACAAGLRAVAGAAAGGRRAAEWLALADRIVAETSATATHSSGRWQRAIDDQAHDAALLLAGLRGAVPHDDPRTVATLETYLHDLTNNGYAYRFRHDDRPLHHAEGSFLLCGFLTALSLHQQGRRLEAHRWYEITRAACGPPQLFSEEFDEVQHQMRGNLPQAFVHALHIETATVLGPLDDRA
jgi:alpha,alpha-trehalase